MLIKMVLIQYVNIMRAINRYDIGKVFSYYLIYYCKVYYVVYVNVFIYLIGI